MPKFVVMKTYADISCDISSLLSQMLTRHGVHQVFASPGSRNMPLIGAMHYNPGINLRMIVDERSAAFSALGFATIKNQPTAICCTSGTAMLNYAPAIAEAYYRNIPLIVITADRPLSRLNKGDSQMIDQSQPLKAITSIGIDITETDSVTSAQTKIAQALIVLKEKSQPVHINIRFDKPFHIPAAPLSEIKFDDIIIETPRQNFDTSFMRTIAREIASPAKVILYVGQMQPDARLSKAIRRLSQFDNIVIAAEPLSNLHACNNVVYGIDRIFSDNSTLLLESLAPDTLIHIGGIPTSSKFIKYISDNYKGMVWRVSLDDKNNDSFRLPIRQFKSEPSFFVNALASAMQPHKAESNYSSQWHDLPKSQLSGDAKLIKSILDTIPSECNIELSNGLTVRHASLFPPRHHRYSSNRGVNGIDGSTSTAIGASLAYSGDTILITGDMSAIYDMSAWISPLITPRFKAIVIDNNGGGIFRTISPSREFEAREALACCSDFRPDFHSIATACGFDVREIKANDEIEPNVSWLCEESHNPQILIIHNPS